MAQVCKTWGDAIQQHVDVSRLVSLEGREQVALRGPRQACASPARCRWHANPAQHWAVSRQRSSRGPSSAALTRRMSCVKCALALILLLFDIRLCAPIPNLCAGAVEFGARARMGWAAGVNEWMLGGACMVEAGARLGLFQGAVPCLRREGWRSEIEEERIARLFPKPAPKAEGGERCLLNEAQVATNGQGEWNVGLERQVESRYGTWI